MQGPEHEAIRKRYIELRYRLMPYIYTGIEEMSRTGVPLMRPIFLEYPKASDFYGENREFLFGRDLLVAPVLTEMVDDIEDQFPPGDWFDYWSGYKFTNAKEAEAASGARSSSAVCAGWCNHSRAAGGAKYGGDAGRAAGVARLSRKRLQRLTLS